MFKQGYVGVSLLRFVGPGAVNRGKNGELKSISIGGDDIRDRNSTQKVKDAIRSFFKEAEGVPMSLQSRAWGLWISTELINRGIPKEKADKFAKEIMDNFLDHNKAKAQEKKDAAEKKKKNAIASGKEIKEKKEKNPLYSETVRLFPEEQAQLQLAIEGLANGTIKEPKDINFNHMGYAADILFHGTMRPVSRLGAVSVGHAFGVNSMASEDDYFVAKDDFRNEPWYQENPESSAHMGTTNLSAPLMYNYIEVNKDLLIKNLNGNVQEANKLIGLLIEAACKNGARSSSTGGAQTHTYASYAVIEKMTGCPRSLGAAFERPASTIEEAVSRIRSFREALNKAYAETIPYKEFFFYTDSSGKMVTSPDTINELIEFAKS
jgi:CRISPR system Cascade subunit CasC